MEVTFETPEYNDPLAGRYAGYWLRFFAAVIDLVIYTPLYFAVKVGLGVNHALASEIIFSLFALLTYAAFFSSVLQASPGMYLLKFHVTDEHGGRISYAKALKWGVVSSIGIMLCCVGLFYMEYRFGMTAVNQLMMSCVEENLRMEDCIAEAESMIGFPYNTFLMMQGASVLLALFLMVVWSLSIALAKDKAGFHNLICHTRFIKGRPS